MVMRCLPVLHIVLGQTILFNVTCIYTDYTVLFYTI